MAEKVPVLDLHNSREVQIETLDRALRKYGFFYLANHGIDTKSQFDAAEQLFSLPKKEKVAMPFDVQLDYGYVGTGGQNLDYAVTSSSNNHDENLLEGDTKEQFMQTNNVLLTTDDVSATQIDPTNVFQGSKNYDVKGVPNYKATTLQYANEAYALDHKLNALLFDALELSDDQREDLGTKPFIVLKQMKYHGEISDPAKGKFGANPHTDWGAFTLLATDNTPGLEILMEDEATQAVTWLPVPPRPGCLIINSGDQISQLTNGVYRSAMHRVVTTSTKPRFSTAVFTYFSIDCRVDPLDKFRSSLDDRVVEEGAGRTTKEHFYAKLHSSMGLMVNSSKQLLK